MTVRISLVGDSPIGRIRPEVFGHFVEHMGRCVYGGIVNEESGSPVEVVEGLIADLAPPLIRYPGGCFAAEYHWWEGVGETRPVGIDTFWSRVGLSRPESNAFGTDEFLALCDRVGAEAYFTVNMGTGTPTEAAEWVRYTDGRVALWSLGNEVFGPWETGHEGPEDYARRAEAYADAMLASEPGLQLIGVGADPRNYLNWNRHVLARIGRRLRAISLHFYAPGPEAGSLEDTRDGYLSIVASSYVLADGLDRMIATVRSLELNTPIAIDEWAVWSCDDELRGAAESGESAPIRDALFAASVFHRIFERPNVVTLACYAQLVNVLGLIQSDGEAAYATPVYEIFKLYQSVAGGMAGRVEVSGSPTFEAPELGRLPRAFEIPFVDAAAVSLEDGSTALFLINRHPSAEISVEVSGTSGEAAVSRLSGDGPFARNSFAEPERVRIENTDVVLPRLTLPPHSASRVSVDRW